MKTTQETTEFLPIIISSIDNITINIANYIYSLESVMKKSSRNWSPQEDKMLELTLMGSNGDRKLKWQQIAELMQKKIGCQKTGKQCRQRWHNHLAPQLNNSSEWTKEENNTLFLKHSQLGNKWAKIATFLKGRTDNCVKNHFYSTLRRGMRKVNNFIHDQRKQKNSIKQFKPDVLTKILIVADGDPQQKLNAKNNASELSKNIKQLLISVSLDTDENTYDQIKIDKIIGYIMQFNKNCKKRKGKKKTGTTQKNINEDKDKQQIEQQQQQQMRSQQPSQIVNKIQPQSYIKQRNITLNLPNQKQQSTLKYQSSTFHNNNNNNNNHKKQLNQLKNATSTAQQIYLPSPISNIPSIGTTIVSAKGKQIKEELQPQPQLQVKPRLKKTFVNEEDLVDFKFPQNFNGNAGNKFKQIAMPAQPIMKMNINNAHGNINTNTNNSNNNHNHKNNNYNINNNQQFDDDSSQKKDNVKLDINSTQFLQQNNNYQRKMKMNKAYSAEIDIGQLNDNSYNPFANNKISQPVQIFAESGIGFNFSIGNGNQHSIVSRELLADSAAQVYQSNVILNNLSSFSQRNSILNFDGDKGVIDPELLQSGELRRSAMGHISPGGLNLSNSLKLEQLQMQMNADSKK